MKNNFFTTRFALTLCFCFLFLSSITAQTKNPPGNTFPSTGNAGVGTTTPVEKLEVVGTIKGTVGKFTDKIYLGDVPSSDDGYILHVDGKMRATEIKVYTGWADFVFEHDYDLPTLSEVEAYIIKFGHLKDIPTAADVEKNGINVGEMNKLLLQKIEELTLYVIDLNKEIERLKQNISTDESE